MPYPRTIAMLLFAATVSAAPATADDCLSCHPHIASQLKGNSHHIQGVTPAGRHCHACHWEATAAGAVDERFHQRDTTRIDLVLWENGARPAEYSPGSTAIVFSSKAVGNAGERAAFAGISRHCLSCHNDSTSRVAVFDGDPNQPGSYAWDGTSIDARYSSRGTTTWGKYSTPTSNRKMRVTKALSAHGNAVANAGGWSPSEGYDGRIPDTRTGGSNVECFDCHNSHGSAAEGVTSSYRTADGTLGGGILKQTVAGAGGYAMSYAPKANSDRSGKNPYNTGAGLCFDCHETAASGTTPWGYRSTFGASEPVMGYKDTHRFGPGVKGSTSRYASRQGRSALVSSHLKAGTFLNHSALYPVSGLCTPCHDPHGVSPTLGKDMQYAVPLLKGTWLSSPYREDAPPSAGIRERQAAQGTGMPTAVSGSSRGPVSMQGMQYNVDRNTLGADRRIVEGEERFAGLCLKCHTRVKPAGETKSDRIHRSVKGWGANREHAFPCAKCHQAHNSGLPRLMQTNCFEEGPAGLRENFGLSWLPEKKGGETSSGGGNDRSVGNRKPGTSDLVGCHVRQFGRGGVPQDRGQWREKSNW